MSETSLPNIDTHCHLYAGIDDGPRHWHDAEEMCRIAVRDGTGTAFAVAHQGEVWEENSPDRILAAAEELRRRLADAAIPLAIIPVGEVALEPDFLARFDAGEYLTLGDQKKYLLLELPGGFAVNALPFVEQLMNRGTRPIIAHAERYQNLLAEPGLVERLIEAGALIQVTSRAIAGSRNRRTRTRLKEWARRNMIHLLGSDGHSKMLRPPIMAAAVRQLVRWTSPGLADRIAFLNALALCEGRALPIEPPAPVRRKFLGIW